MRLSQIRPEMLHAPQAENLGTPGGISLWDGYLRQMVSAIAAFDEARLEEIYNGALSLYPIERVTRQLLVPLLVELGERWETGHAGIAEEHFFAFYLRNKLGARFHHRSRPESGPLLLLAGLPGENHEIALLLFALAANEMGFRLLPLGANMPLGELAWVASSSHCKAIVLSGAVEPSAAMLEQDLTRLVRGLEIPVFVGGRASVVACDAINKAGAEALGQDMERGLRRLAERLK
jgi:methanogenic corrinoid protein MtbC1